MYTTESEAFFEARRERLHRVASTARATVPHYRTAWSSFELPPIKEFDYRFFTETVPLLEKKDIGESLLSDQARAADLHHESTSGTEGRPLVCYKSRAEQLRCTVNLWRQRQRWVPGLSPRDRFARFYAFRGTGGGDHLVTNQVLYRDNDILIPLFDLSEQRMAEYWRALLAFGPRWMHGPSTAIFTLARFVRDSGADPGGLEFVELNGEYVPEEQEQLIREVFGCAVANNYGSREFWTLAYSCPAGVMHIQDDSVLIEALAEPSGAESGGVEPSAVDLAAEPGAGLGAVPGAEHGELVVSTLSNTAWPLIRYRIKDIGAVSAAPACGCGQAPGFALRLERGRTADYFTLADGRTINAILFSGVIRGLSTLARRPLIYQYQVVRRASDVLEIALCVDRSGDLDPDEVVRRYDAELRRVIGSRTALRYQVVDAIAPDPRTGKVRDFIDAAG